MHARSAPLTVPASPRYRTVLLEAHGPHPLRAPTYAGAYVVRRLLDVATSRATAPRGSQAWLEEVSTALAAVVGLCWWHQELALDAPAPALHAPIDEWFVYGEAVADELLEQGYSLSDLAALYQEAYDATGAVHEVLTLAMERRDFSSEPEGAAPGPEAASGARATT